MQVLKSADVVAVQSVVALLKLHLLMEVRTTTTTTMIPLGEVSLSMSRFVLRGHQLMLRLLH
jgi:hypothetical protein